MSIINEFWERQAQRYHPLDEFERADISSHLQQNPWILENSPLGEEGDPAAAMEEQMVAGELRAETAEDPFTAWREVQVEDIDDISLEGTGEAWTLTGPEQGWGGGGIWGAIEGTKNVLIEAKIPWNSVDWMATVATNKAWPDEREIRVVPGATIIPVSATDQMTGESISLGGLRAVAEDRNEHR